MSTDRLFHMLNFTGIVEKQQGYNVLKLHFPDVNPCNFGLVHYVIILCIGTIEIQNTVSRVNVAV